MWAEAHTPSGGTPLAAVALPFAAGDAIETRTVWLNGTWLWPAVVAGVVLAALVIWSWYRGRRFGAVSVLAVVMKLAAIALLLAVLLEPMRSVRSPEPQSNIVAVLIDNSRSLKLTDEDPAVDDLRSAVTPDADWLRTLEADFDVRLFQFDERATQVESFDRLTGEGAASNLNAALADVRERFAGRPLAGIVALTDGVATDASMDVESSDGVPIYPVPFGEAAPGEDLRIVRVSTREANFEAAPVEVSATVRADGLAGKASVVRLIDEAGKVVESQTLDDLPDGEPVKVRFRLQPEGLGVQFYRLAIAAKDAEFDAAKPVAIAGEQTGLNNVRTLLVDRSGGPYRVLYVSGRPNWEFKFLRRALDEDDQIELVGLVRIAKREAKFTFRSDADRANPLFRGFDSDEETAEQYDEPVLVRLGTKDGEELRGGFPKDREGLFPFHAVIIDDLEAAFFTEDQKALLQEFVRLRGGGLLMLGGQESFQGGGYARTPIGDVLPVYADREGGPSPPGEYRLSLTREGWLQPWARLRPTENEEHLRLRRLSGFQTLNRTPSIKPGARVLSEVESADGDRYPALVTQPFGRGRSAALMIGDFWRSHLRREKQESDDLSKAWRQTVRWLVADVPTRVDVGVIEDAAGVRLRTTVRDEEFRLLDNAAVRLTVTKPDGTEVELTASPRDEVSGEYEAPFRPRLVGGYRVKAVAVAADGSEIGRATTGLVNNPLADELRQLHVDRDALSAIAEASGGEVVEPGDLDSFVASLQEKEMPAMRTTIKPLWHSWIVLTSIMGLLIGEWGLRRWKGLP